jgi:hypothetical protein
MPLIQFSFRLQKTLHEAIELVHHDDLVALRSIVDEHLIQAKDESGDSIISAAVLADRWDVVRMLMGQFGNYVDRQLMNYLPVSEVSRLRRSLDDSRSGDERFDQGGRDGIDDNENGLGEY